MLSYLRSLQTLVFFEAAGRHASFKKAAAELHVTPSAVSRQIAMLEQDLGVSLFRRLHRGLELSPAGAAYFAEVSDALARLDRASRGVRTTGEARLLRISVLHGFAGNWLVPRLARFQAAHPDVEVRLEATTTYADFRNDEIDLAIRFGTGPWPGLHAERLLDLELFPVCRPSLLRGRPRLREPADLAQHTLLCDVRVPEAWPHWLEAAGVPGLRPRKTLRYDNAPLTIDAAMAGLGVALATDLLAERSLRDRRLVRPFAVAATSPQTYHLVARPEDVKKPHVRAFRDWLVGEMDAWRKRPGASARVRAAQSRVRNHRLSERARGR
jgi:LysR family transcriptional regulator, glycine cleavage system transcriptional activator